MKKHILIVDDEEPARYELERCLSEAGDFKIDQAHSASEALDKLKREQFDIVFLDINMPGRSGIDCAREISQTDTRIVFVTAYNEYALEAFSVAAVDYILKPVKTDRLKETLRRIDSMSGSSKISEFLEAFSSGKNTGRRKIIGKKRSSDEKVFLDSREIGCFKAADTDCYAFVNGERWVVGGTIKGYEDEFGDSFLRVHKAYLVNIDKIKGFRYYLAGGYRLTIEGMKDKIPVSRTYAKQFKDRMRI